MKPIRSLSQVIEDRKKEQEAIRESFKKKKRSRLQAMSGKNSENKSSG